MTKLQSLGQIALHSNFLKSFSWNHFKFALLLHEPMLS